MTAKFCNPSTTHFWKKRPNRAQNNKVPKLHMAISTIYVSSVQIKSKHLEEQRC